MGRYYLSSVVEEALAEKPVPQALAKGVIADCELHRYEIAIRDVATNHVALFPFHMRNDSAPLIQRVICLYDRGSIDKHEAIEMLREHRAAAESYLRSKGFDPDFARGHERKEEQEFREIIAQDKEDRARLDAADALIKRYEKEI